MTKRPRPADPQLVAWFESLFGETAARHAYEIFSGRDALAGAVSGARGETLWRAWQAGRAAVANGQPLQGMRALQRSAKRYPIDDAGAGLADVERQTLLADCLQRGEQVPASLRYTSMAQLTLQRFIDRLESDRAAAGREIREAIEVLTSTQFKSADQTDAIIDGWAMGRGLTLLTELAHREADLSRRLGGSSTRSIVAALDANVERLSRCAGVAISAREAARVRFAAGNIVTDVDPDEAYAHFDAVVQTLGFDDGLGLQAAANAANCLLAAERFQEAERLYAFIESFFEHNGDRMGAARVWIGECSANWRRLRDPSIRNSLIGAIKMFEESIPPRTDVMTRYSLKKYAESGYALLATINATSDDRSDARLDEMLSATWAMLSRDTMANLEPKPSDEPWVALLGSERRPLAAMRTALAPFAGLAVAHVLSGIASLVWMVYGYDDGGRFRFASAALGGTHIDDVTRLLRLMEEQREADRIGDALAMATIARELEAAGDAITAQLPMEMVELLTAMRRVIFLPQPFGSLDQFPLTALRVNGSWLGEILPVIRGTNVSWLREALSATRALVRPNRAAAVALGAPDATGEALRGMAEESGVVRRFLGALGFDATIHDKAGTADMLAWLGGGVGAVHYIGHGFASEVQEGLPLATGEMFQPILADRLAGFRVPFLFFGTCMAARVRGGAGGYQTGLVSRLVERGAPAAVAFSMPVIEERAYAAAEQFYRAAYRLPFGEAVRETWRETRDSVPTYIRLAFTAYGDPAFELRAMAGSGTVPMLRSQAESWHSRLRTHCVLRTQETADALAARMGDVPAPLHDHVARWLETAFRGAAPETPARLDEMELAALAATECRAVERLSVRAAVCAERLHGSGIETAPIVIDTEAASIRRLLANARFLSVLGGALFDMPLNGLGNSLMGRVVTIDQNGADNSALFLRQGRQSLLECEDRSPFVRELRRIDALLLDHYGMSA